MATNLALAHTENKYLRQEIAKLKPQKHKSIIPNPNERFNTIAQVWEEKQKPKPKSKGIKVKVEKGTPSGTPGTPRTPGTPGTPGIPGISGTPGTPEILDVSESEVEIIQDVIVVASSPLQRTLDARDTRAAKCRRLE